MRPVSRQSLTRAASAVDGIGERGLVECRRAPVAVVELGVGNGACW